MDFDLLILGGPAVTSGPEERVVEDACVAVRNGAVEAVFARPPGEPLPAARDILDAEGGMILPGLVNAHTHLPMTLFRGLADDLPLEEWLTGHMFPAEAAHINPENVRIGAELACAELLLSGTTTLCDGYFLENESAEVVLESGLRAVMAQGVIGFPAPGVPDPAKGVETAESFVQSWLDRSDRIRPSIFCHSPYTVPAETLKRAKAACRDLGVLFQIHAAETAKERLDSIREHGLSPVAWLDSLGVLDEHTLLVHSAHVDRDDIVRIADSGASVVACPGSNMKLASGVMPLAGFLEKGVAVGIGTDGAASNNSLNLFREMDHMAKLQKLHAMDPTAAPAGEVFALATRVGAKAVGLAQTGSIEPGKRADVVVMDPAAPWHTPLHNPVSSLVYAADAGHVRHVVVDGRVVVRDREILTLDLDRILARAREAARAIG